MLTPTIDKTIGPFNQDKSFKLDFNYVGSSQAVTNQVEIQKTSDNTVVYDSTIPTLALSHNVPANTLLNGNEYKIRVKVGDINGNWSNYSSWTIFWVLNNPQLDITTIVNGQVGNQIVDFETLYTHPDDEPLESFKYYLFDSSKNTLKIYDEQFSDGVGSLTQNVNSLENGTQYYIEVKTISVHGQEATTGLVGFIAKFITPKLYSQVKAENIPNEGAIKVSVNVFQLIGIVTSDTEPIYVDGEWIDLRNASIAFEDGFNITTEDCVMKLWCKHLPIEKTFMKMYSPEGYIEVQKYDDKIHVFTHLHKTNIVGHFASNELVVTDDQPIMIYINSINGLFEVEQHLVI